MQHTAHEVLAIIKNPLQNAKFDCMEMKRNTKNENHGPLGTSACPEFTVFSFKLMTLSGSYFRLKPSLKA
jgi:hypothetical protein